MRIPKRSSSGTPDLQTGQHVVVLHVLRWHLKEGLCGFVISIQICAGLFLWDKGLIQSCFLTGFQHWRAGGWWVGYQLRGIHVQGGPE